MTLNKEAVYFVTSTDTENMSSDEVLDALTKSGFIGNKNGMFEDELDALILKGLEGKRKVLLFVLLDQRVKMSLNLTNELLELIAIMNDAQYTTIASAFIDDSGGRKSINTVLLKYIAIHCADKALTQLIANDRFASSLSGKYRSLATYISVLSENASCSQLFKIFVDYANKEDDYSVNYALSVFKFKKLKDILYLLSVSYYLSDDHNATPRAMLDKYTNKKTVDAILKVFHADKKVVSIAVKNNQEELIPDVMKKIFLRKP